MSGQRLSIGFSPCPNDTFVFDALVNGRIDTQGIDFDVHLADVQELNELAQHAQLDITKLSYAAWPGVSATYQLLNSGSALGNNCGPLLIAKQNIALSGLHQLKVAIPGLNTTANLLLSVAFPQAQNRVAMPFHTIEQAVLSGQVDAGVIIHENRFTYAQKGLVKLIDLGEHWEQTTRRPIPLGGIAIKRKFDNGLRLKVDQLIRASIEYAFAHRDASHDYVMAHAQEMSVEVAQQHINLYVNQYSINLGAVGRSAVEFLFERAGLGYKEPAFVGG